MAHLIVIINIPSPFYQPSNPWLITVKFKCKIEICVCGFVFFPCGFDYFKEV